MSLHRASPLGGVCRDVTYICVSSCVHSSILGPDYGCRLVWLQPAPRRSYPLRTCRPTLCGHAAALIQFLQQAIMKTILSLGLLFAPLSVAGDLFNLKRQTPASAVLTTSSVFAVPTPTSDPTINSSTYDLSQHFCRIWRHQSQ